MTAKIDILDVTILADGTIRTETSKISGPNHQSAEAFLQALAELTGSQGERKRRVLSAHHARQHEHETEKH